MLGSEVLTTDVAVIVLTVLGSATMSTLWITNKLHKMDLRLGTLEMERWSIEEMRSWARQLRENNDDLEVPSVSDILAKEVH